MSFESGGIEVRRKCPACAGYNFQIIFRMPYQNAALREFLLRFYCGRADPARLIGATYELALCNSCRLLFQTQVPSGTLLSDIYDVWIPPTEQQDLRSRRGTEQYRYLAFQVESMIRHFRRHPTDLNVLDFGCGWAEWASMARAFGCNVYGIELSVERKQFARSIGIPILDNPHHPGVVFDFINTEQVFEHLTRPLETLKELVSCLAPGGLIKISVPNGRGVLRRITAGETFPMPVQPLEHINCFTAQSLYTFGCGAGLKLVTPRMIDMYNAASGWLNLRQAAKNLARPIYRHVFPGSTYQFFERL
ncbi:MAG: class I SAM-dependent methyltransferase [Rhizomicrobium sp.]